MGAEFPQQTLGMDTFSMSMHCSFHAIAWESNSHIILLEFHPTSLHGNEIPIKWLGNEIPTNHPSELYTIYNPASLLEELQIPPIMAAHRCNRESPTVSVGTPGRPQ